jgi:hypothetical protein
VNSAGFRPYILGFFVESTVPVANANLASGGTCEIALCGAGREQRFCCPPVCCDQEHFPGLSVFCEPIFASPKSKIGEHHGRPFNVMEYLERKNPAV